MNTFSKPGKTGNYENEKKRSVFRGTKSKFRLVSKNSVPYWILYRISRKKNVSFRVVIVSARPYDLFSTVIIVSVESSHCPSLFCIVKFKDNRLNFG